MEERLLRGLLIIMNDYDNMIPPYRDDFFIDMVDLAVRDIPYDMLESSKIDYMDNREYLTYRLTESFYMSPKIPLILTLNSIEIHVNFI